MSDAPDDDPDDDDMVTASEVRRLERAQATPRGVLVATPDTGDV